MHFRLLTGDVNWRDYGGKFISRKLNNGDFDYWLVMEIVNWPEAIGEREASELGATYNVTLSAVSPAEAGADNLRSAMQCCGIDETPTDPITQVELLHEYGISSPVWSENGNNLRRLMRESRRHADTMGDMLFGFAMDAPKNRLGTTGWECLRGDILAPLRRMDDSTPPETKLVAKLHGME